MTAIPREPRIGIAGATGAVGQEFLRLLAERRFPMKSLRLFASSRSVGKRMTFGGEELVVEELARDAMTGVDLWFFSCGASRSREFASVATAAGGVVVDNSSAFRLDDGVPLVVPEINREAAVDGDGALVAPVLANPNCSTILLVLALAPLHAAFGLRRVIVSTYQAASGAGDQAMRALLADTRSALEGEPSDECRAHFGQPLAFNLVPQISDFIADGPDAGSTLEEAKMVHETRKILGLPQLAVDATCIRVPVLRSHSESVTIETEEPVTVAAARDVIAAAKGVELVDDPLERRYPMPMDTSERDAVAIGRIRESRVFDNGVSLWLSGDQLRKGAALNAIQIAESVMTS